jgi:glutaredoxin
MSGIINGFCQKMGHDKFKCITTIIVVVLLVFLFLIAPSDEKVRGTGEIEINFFYSPGCTHCAEQKKFNNTLLQKYNVKIIAHDISHDKNEIELFYLEAKKHNIPKQSLGVPLTIVNDQAFLGFKSAQSTGKVIEIAVKERHVKSKTRYSVSEKQQIPFLGEVDVAKYSLPVLAMILGLIDGFNPCAMWALVFLIGLVTGLHDNKKLWLLVGTFVITSGVLYFLFMTAWLNVFLFIGFIRPVVTCIGACSIWLGIIQTRDFFVGKVACPLPTEQKQKIMHRMKTLVMSPITLVTFFGIVLLAFAINLIEFVCSSFIPAIYTQTLALHHLPVWQYYFYIFLYDFFFMLDDLVIFSLAIFAITNMGDKYAKWCKLAGGITLFTLGVMLILPS